MVSSMFFSIFLNGSPTRTLNPTQGIRQEDTLSPFMFLITIEGISLLIQGQLSRGEIRGLNIHRGMDKQTHQ